MQEVFSDLIKVLLPAGLVLYASFLFLRSFLNKQLIEQKQTTQAEAIKTTLPLRIQAYERLCLLLERISPNALLIRTAGQALNARDLQQLLLSEIREEFQHNVAQQLYVSDEAWERLRLTTQELSSLVNLAASDITTETPAIELARKISELAIGRPTEFWQETLLFIKAEARQLWQ
ncbi:MAG: hypothetical protein QM669_15890 [Siphonobacter sp.]